ncbi:MAG: hypothetical protein ABJB74_19995 [Gemmatimonas sp.]
MSLSHGASIAHAQRVLTIDEQARADARRGQLEQTRRDAEKKAASISADAQSRQMRINSAVTPTAGLNNLKANAIAVTRFRVIMTYNEPAVLSELPKGARDGYYLWRWDVNDGATQFSVVLAPDGPMRTSDLGDLLKASRMRKCRSIFETSALSCTEPIEGFVMRLGTGFRMEIMDTSIVRMVQSGRPRAGKLVTFSPHGRSVSAGVQIVYVDPTKNE